MQCTLVEPTSSYCVIYSCTDLTEVNKKNKGEMLTWLSSERAAETAAAAAGGDDDDK